MKILSKHNRVKIMSSGTLLLMGVWIFGAHGYAESYLKSSAAPKQWQDYTNMRFQYQICYPDYMHGQGASDNGDGQLYIGQDGANLRVYGSYDISVFYGGDFLKTVEADKQYITTDHGRVTYFVYRPQSAIISGLDKDGHIFYMKILKGKQDQSAVFILTYPVSLHKKYNIIISKISECFKMID